MSETPVHPPRRRWRKWLFVLLIFLAGAACGGAAATAAIFRSFHHAVMHPEDAPARIAARLTRRLDLNDDQAARVRAIIGSRQRALLEIRRDVQPRIERQLDQLESDIAAELTPPQQVKWHAMLAMLRKNWLPPAPAAPPSTAPVDAFRATR